MICPFCSKKDIPKIVVDNLVPAYSFDKRNTFTYLQCNCCKIVYISPFSNSQTLKKKVYNKFYFKNEKLSFVQSIVYRISLYKDYPQLVNSILPGNGRILDVGCGEGTFMEKMKELGWDTYGIEVNRYLVEKLEKIFGKGHVYSSDFKKNTLKNDKFDAITFWHVIEHLDKPVQALKIYKSLLKRGGTLFIEVPNVDSWVFKIFGNKYTWLRIPDHLYYYSPYTIKELLKRSGYRNIHVWTPMKANLNFSLNLYSILNKKIPITVQKFILILSAPISICFSLFASLFSQGEIIRASAEN